MDFNDIINRADASLVSEEEFEFVMDETHTSLATRIRSGSPPSAEETKLLLEAALDNKRTDEDRDRWFQAMRSYWLTGIK